MGDVSAGEGGGGGRDRGTLPRCIDFSTAAAPYNSTPDQSAIQSALWSTIAAAIARHFSDPLPGARAHSRVFLPSWIPPLSRRYPASKTPAAIDSQAADDTFARRTAKNNVFDQPGGGGGAGAKPRIYYSPYLHRLYIESKVLKCCGRSRLAGGSLSSLPPSLPPPVTPNPTSRVRSGAIARIDIAKEYSTARQSVFFVSEISAAMELQSREFRCGPRKFVARKWHWLAGETIRMYA